MGKIKRIITVIFCILLIGSFIVPKVTAGSLSSKFHFRPFKLHHRIKVISENLYVGANIFRALEPIPEPIPADFPFPPELWTPWQVAQVFLTIQQTNFYERAETIAQLIAWKNPDLIGLQEVSLIRRQVQSDFLVLNPGTGSFEIINTEPNAIEVEFDYEQILLDALAAKGLHYYVAVRQENVDIELPMIVDFLPNPPGPPIPIFDDVRLTDRDVILARRNIKTKNPTAEKFGAQLVFPFTLPGNVPLQISFDRGFVAVDAEVKRRYYRFVNTHLELQGEDLGDPQLSVFQAMQAQELVSRLSVETLPIVLVGDFNSSPTDLPITIDSTEIIPPYLILTNNDYIDTWLRRIWRYRNHGFTCCQAENLLNDESMHDERIDHIFVRNQIHSWHNSVVGPVIAFTIGDKKFQKTPSGLWPSDHAGVGAILWIR